MLSSRNKVIAQQTTNSSINPLESLINLLPCNKPIKSIQVIENINECQSNFLPIHKTYDQDLDADILKENILFGKRNTRYICISKTEGFENYVVEKLKIINANENLASEGYISIKTTTDTNKKAWNKKQLVYKLAKTENCTNYITDIIVLSKYNKSNPPDGFNYLGELEKVHLCFKISSTSSSKHETEIIDFTNQIENLKIQSSLYPMVNNGEHYYEQLQLSYQLPSPNRPTPMRAAPLPPNNTGTLSHYQTDFVGIPFVLNPKLVKNNYSLDIISTTTPAHDKSESFLDYDFNLERQILCSTKNENRKSTSTNPFF